MELCVISSISCLFCFVFEERPCWTPSSGCSSTRWKRSGAKNNEAVDVGMEDDPKILPKYVGRKGLFFFLFVKERGGLDGRAANSLKHKNFNDDNVIYLFFFLSFRRAKLYVLSRCKPVLIFVKKADYSSSIRIWSKCSYRTSSRKIPGSFTSSMLRSLAKSLENWLLTAMNGCSEDIIILSKFEK